MNTLSASSERPAERAGVSEVSSTYGHSSDLQSPESPTDEIPTGKMSPTSEMSFRSPSSIYPINSEPEHLPSNPTPLPTPEEGEIIDHLDQNWEEKTDMNTTYDFRLPDEPRSPKKKPTGSSFSVDVPFPSNFIGHPSGLTMAHLIHANPSILPSHQRATYLGPGTPMPMLPPEAYAYPTLQWNNTPNVQVPNQTLYWPGCLKSELSTSPHPEIALKRKRNRKRGKQRRGEKKDIIMKPLILAEKLSRKNRKKSKAPENLSKNSEVKKAGARLWLKAKAELTRQSQVKKKFPPSLSFTPDSGIESESISPRFVDRATSPINFYEGGQTHKETRDIALSPLHFIEPRKKKRSGTPRS